jgi:CYTH domain-containing protein
MALMGHAPQLYAVLTWEVEVHEGAPAGLVATELSLSTKARIPSSPDGSGSR